VHDLTFELSFWEVLYYFAIISALSIVGGLVGNKLKIPAGGMLGAMLAMLVFNLLYQPTFSLPAGFLVALQLAFGPMLGSRISRDDIGGLIRLAKPASVIVAIMLAFNIIFGIAMSHLTRLDVATTLFATAPGGMMDMAIVSADFGANSAYVALLQLSRIIFILVCMMPFYKKFRKSEVIDEQLKDEMKEEEKPEAVASNSKRSTKQQIAHYLITMLYGSVLGLLFRQIGIPAGGIIGAMLGAAIYNISTKKAYFPPEMRLPLQIIAGTFIGFRMDRASLLAMGELILPVLILFVCVIVITSVTAFVVHKVTGLDMFTALLASTPGGLSEMALLADDVGADAPKVALLHMARLITVIVVFPSVLALVLMLLS